MIEFKRDGSKIKIITDVISIAYNYTASIELSSEPYAVLLRKEIQENLDRLVRGIRQQAYNEGWKDKQQKKPKKEWFYSQLKHTQTAGI